MNHFSYHICLLVCFAKEFLLLIFYLIPKVNADDIRIKAFREQNDKSNTECVFKFICDVDPAFTDAFGVLYIHLYDV